MTTAALLNHVGRAMHDPVRGTQQAFRALLDAMARPGSVVTLPPVCIDGVEPPLDSHGTPLHAALVALLLTLLDRETSLRLHGELASDAVAHYLRFHTGVQSAPRAAFEVMRAHRLDRTLREQFELGSDEEPQRGATVIVEMPYLGPEGSPPIALRGPGIEATQQLPVSSLEPAVWRWRMQRQADFPRGVDVVFVCGTQVAALPRSTRLEEVR